MIDVDVDIKTKDPDEHDENEEWQLCCSKSSKAFIKYITTVFMSTVVLIFSIIMVALNPDRDNSIYFSMISSIISLYVNPPQIEKTN